MSCNKKMCDMPMVNFGTWQIPKNCAAEFVSKALQAGYKGIDCAAVYDNEEDIGEVFKSLQDRSSIFITSKLWSDSHSPEKVMSACNKTLSDLKLQYLDMYLVHNPIRIKGISMNESGKYVCDSIQEASKDRILETWREMEKLVEAGLCKNVGVSNFTVKKLKYILEEASVIPANNQIELHPYLPQRKLISFCFENGILPSAYSPLGNPGLINTPFGKPEKPMLLQDPILQEMASSAGITPAQVVLSWAVTRGTPVLVKSSSEFRMIENLSAASIVLTPQQLAIVDSLEKVPGCRYLEFEMFCAPDSQADFWDGET